MLQTLKDYCYNNTIPHGLFLLDMPTGYGKTTAVSACIRDLAYDNKHFGSRKILFLTTQKRTFQTLSAVYVIRLKTKSFFSTPLQTP